MMRAYCSRKQSLIYCKGSEWAKKNPQGQRSDEEYRLAMKSNFGWDKAMYAEYRRRDEELKGSLQVRMYWHSTDANTTDIRINERGKHMCKKEFQSEYGPVWEPRWRQAKKAVANRDAWGQSMPQTQTEKRYLISIRGVTDEQKLFFQMWTNTAIELDPSETITGFSLRAIVRQCEEDDTEVPQVQSMHSLHDSDQAMREDECKKAVIEYHRIKNVPNWKPVEPEVQADYHPHIRKPKASCWGSPGISREEFQNPEPAPAVKEFQLPE